MSHTMKLFIGLAVLTILAMTVATVFVGSKVREETVVERPYEEGLRHDADRSSRAALGLALRLDDEAPPAGKGPIALRLADRGGQPFTGATVAVELSRPDTSRGEVRGAARETEPGRYVAELAAPAPGPWDVRVDVARGEERVRLERRIAARIDCDLGAASCSSPVDGGTVTLELSPRPLRTMSDLAVRAEVAGVEPAAVSVSFTMKGMRMGDNVSRLARRGAAWEGKAVLVRCPSGRKDWEAEVTIERPGAPPAQAVLPITVAE